QAVHAAEEIPQPAADDRNRALNLRPYKVNGKVPHNKTSFDWYQKTISPQEDGCLSLWRSDANPRPTIAVIRHDLHPCTAVAVPDRALFPCAPVAVPY